MLTMGSGSGRGATDRRTILIYRGHRLSIEAACLASGGAPAEEFLDSLGDSDAAKMQALFALVGDQYPQVFNREKFKRVEGSDKIFELKSFQIRVLCFFVPGGRLILTHGLVKKKDRLDPADITRAETIRAWFFEEGER